MPSNCLSRPMATDSAELDWRKEGELRREGARQGRGMEAEGKCIRWIEESLTELLLPRFLPFPPPTPDVLRAYCST